MLRPALVGNGREEVAGLTDAAAMVVALCKYRGGALRVELDAAGLEELERSGLVDVVPPSGEDLARFGSGSAVVTARAGR